MKCHYHDAGINRRSYAWLFVFIGLGLWVLLHPTAVSVARPGATMDPSASSTAHQSAVSIDSSRLLPSAPGALRTGHRNIEDVRVGQRVFARNPEISDDERAAWEEPDWSQWRLAKLEMAQPDGGVLKIELIRPRDWFALEAEEPGAEIWLDLPEMGAEGPAKVQGVSDCPPIRSGPGQVVTATFAHPPSTAVLDVRFEGEPQPIGVTDNHHFWSVEREQFLPIGQMSIGDHVLTYSGDTKCIESKLPRPGPELVYNLEVYGEHVYFVGEAGVLVHNNYWNDFQTATKQVFGSRADAAAAYRHLTSGAGRLSRPTVTDPKLWNLVNKNMYKAASQLGHGNTADAARLEWYMRNKLGIANFMYKGRDHLTGSGPQMQNALRNWLTNNPTHAERGIAQAMLDDLSNAMTGR